MKHLLPFLLFLFCQSCTPDSPYRRSRENLPKIEDKDKEDIMNMIGAFDSHELVATGSCGGYYGLVAPDFVVYFPAAVKRQSGERTDYIINGKEPMPRLFVYESDTADLPACNDVGGGVNTLLEKVQAVSGRFTVYTGVPGRRKAKDKDLVYIKIHKLVFPDNISGRGDFIIENKVLWGMAEREAAG